MKDQDNTPKIGAGHASAMWRQGLAELRAAFYPESNIAQPTQYGIYGTLTPGEVADSRKPEAERDHDEEPHRASAELGKQPAAEREQREPPTHEPEMG